jgi:Uma2 family endonuclease
MSSTARIKSDRRYTYADYLKFPGDERWEIMDGVAYAMAPAPSEQHQSLLVELSAQVLQQLRGKPCRVYAVPIDVRFEQAETADTVVQPDLVVVCDRDKISERGVVGAPDWIVEVLSPSTAGRDHIAKRALYERRGVREYWLVHPTDRLLTRYLARPEGGYGAAEITELRGRTAVAAVPRLEVDWDLWETLHDADGAADNTGIAGAAGNSVDTD